MRKLILPTMMVALVATALVTTANGFPEFSHSLHKETVPAVCQDSRAPLLCRIQQARQAVWALQETMSLPRTRTSYSDRRKHASEAYRRWVLRLWSGRLDRLEEQQLSLRWQIDREWPQYDEWVRIGVCESGANPPNWQHNSGTYQGALGFYRGSWDAFRPAGYPSEAYLATPLQQMVVAERIYDRYGLTGWGCRGAA